VTTERDPLIKQAKDLAAGAVLLACAGAVAVGLLVLGPPCGHAWAGEGCRLQWSRACGMEA